jgi:glutamine---fructose-6-phosphate transaminase (isomerizing)
VCGIFGIVSKKDDNLGPVLVEACRRLSYRGYDSVGCATISGSGEVDLRKDVGKVEDVSRELNFKEMTGNRGMAQLRWATFGAPSIVNAQPHFDSGKTMVGAHNGNVVNNVALRDMFKKEGITVRSTNDGESCVHAVEYFLRKGLRMEQAVMKANDILEGDYAFVIGKKDEDKLYAVKRGSGLVVGIGEEANYLSSDLPSLLFLTKKIIRIEDGEMVILGSDSVVIKKIEDGSDVSRMPEEDNEEMETAQKGGFPHFMLKEIYEQHDVSRDLLHLLNASPHAARFLSKLEGARNIYFIACGTSYHAALFGAVAFSKFAGRTVIPVLAPQFIPQYLPTVEKGDVGVFVSQSGETKDVLKALDMAKDKGITALGIVNVLGSTLMRESEVYIPIACGYEISVPATKTFMNQALAFLYLAMKLGKKDVSVLNALPSLISETIEMSREKVKEVLPYLKEQTEYYCLGYGSTYSIALEGALKIKEVTYSHCEGMLSTEFKHGPLSSVRKNYPVIFVVSPDDIAVSLSGINEVSCRGGFTIVISEQDDSLSSNAGKTFFLPESGEPLSSLLSVIPLQLMAYHLSVERGFDPDFPRNLSKTLTVD